MLVRDLRVTPRHAGVARLKFCRHHQVAFRQDDLITLPDPSEVDVEWIWLMGGEQFLARFMSTTASGKPSRKVFFGGTDENPFLVELTSMMYPVLEQKGEAAFYEELKPAQIRELEAVYGPANTRRQGDIFAHPTYEDPWQTARDWFETGQDVLISQVQARGLFNTRHCLTGTLLRLKPGIGAFHFEGDMVVGSGVIEQAPDHAPLMLHQPHYLAQTAHLADPPRAD